MMKKLKYLMWIMTVSIIWGACQTNPLEEVEEGHWNKEKRLLGLLFKNQAGDATISINADDPAKGTVEVTIVNPDFSQELEISKMEVSYGAMASVEAGSKMKFDEQTRSAVICVTAVSGGVREYTVRVTALEESLIGKWEIHELDVFGGTGPYYGGVDFVNLSGDPSWWDATTGVAAELDNTLEFTFEGITDGGHTYGTCVHEAGADARFADFTWAGGLPEGQTVIDVNYNYRRIPQGTSRWERDYTAGTVTFTKNDKKYVATLAGRGEIEYWGKKLIIEDSAFKFGGLTTLGNWGPLYSAYDKMIYMPWDYYVQIRKR